MTKFSNFWLPVLICMGIIFYTSSIPGTNISSIFPSQDVFFHIIAYLALGFFFTRALKNTFSVLERWQVVLFAVLFGLAYAISDEYHQLFVPYRCVSGMDILVDVFGSFIGGLLYKK